MRPSLPAGINEEDLSAYIDDRLEPERQAAVDGEVRADPDLARLVAGLRERDEKLRTMAAEILHEPIPDRLRAIVRPVRPNRRYLAVRQIGQIAAALVIGIVAGWFLNRTVPPENDYPLQQFVRQAVLAHEFVAAEHDVDTLRASGERPLLREASNPFQTPLRIPQLIGSDQRPVVFRSIEGGAGPGVQYAYLGDEDNLTSLMIRQHSSSDDLRFGFREIDGRSVLFWLDGPLVYALVGDGSEEEMRAMALGVYSSTADGGSWQQNTTPATTINQ